MSTSCSNHSLSKDIKRTCPNGVDHCICANNVNETTTGPFFYDEDPLGVVHTYLICNPGTCFCKGDPTTPRDTRPDAMKAVLDVCPTGEMNRCLCHDNKKVTFPFDYQTLFLDCRPKRVRERKLSYCEHRLYLIDRLGNQGVRVSVFCSKSCVFLAVCGQIWQINFGAYELSSNLKYSKFLLI